MNWNYNQVTDMVIESNSGSLLTMGLFGLEKESQRITSGGELALTPHPAAFGDKTQNPRITTDFSESQIEMITPPLPSIEETYKALKQINTEVKEGIGSEMLWPLSMPPKLPGDDLIPIARFNETEEGRKKEEYRENLAKRYGRKMQMISGIHYNFSFDNSLLNLLYDNFGNGMDRQEFVNEAYVSAARNFLRYRWLLIYLFGASPVCDSTYNPVIKKELAVIQKCCPDCCDIVKDFSKYITSLRVSRFGYSDTNDGKNNVLFSSLSEYTEKIEKMLAEGSIQRESEFYSPIRPKQVVSTSETQLEALRKNGIKYMEVRIIDLNPFEELGISIDQLRFLQIFMLFCLLNESPEITETELEEINFNHHLVSLYGRRKDLPLYRYSNNYKVLRDFGGEIFKKLSDIAVIIEDSTGDKNYITSVGKEYQKLIDPELLPSQRIVSEMSKSKESFLQFGVRYAKKYSHVLAGRT